MLSATLVYNVTGDNYSSFIKYKHNYYIKNTSMAAILKKYYFYFFIHNNT